YLFREVLGVDVDDVVRKVVATIAVERAKQVQQNTKDWKPYMDAERGIVILPSNVTQLGRSDPKKQPRPGAVRGTLLPGHRGAGIVLNRTHELGTRCRASGGETSSRFATSPRRTSSSF